MNKKFLYVLLNINVILAMEKPSAPTPVDDPLLHLTRSINSKEFRKFVEDNFSIISGFRSIKESHTCLHALAYPMSATELETYNKKHKKNLTAPQMGRVHAYRIDLLLRSDWSPDTDQLMRTNKQGVTAGVLAAGHGYLPVLGRILLSNPPDWQTIIAHLAPEHKKTVFDAYIKQMHQPSPIGILDDLRVTLTNDQYIKLTVWAANLLKSPPSPDAWKELDREQTNYLFECYLSFDILEQYKENPNHPTAKEALGNRN